MISVKTKGDFKNTELFLKRYTDDKNIMPILEKYGEKGVELLSNATPIDSGMTSLSWDYEIESNGKGEYHIQFTNDNINNGVNIAIILQYGHGTRNGGYVKGRDYINPALRQVFEEMRDELVEEVKRR